jgi:hypothetical protein
MEFLIYLGIFIGIIFWIGFIFEDADPKKNPIGAGLKKISEGQSDTFEAIGKLVDNTVREHKYNKEKKNFVSIATEIKSNPTNSELVKPYTQENSLTTDRTLPGPLNTIGFVAINLSMHLSRVALINFEDREKLALEFHNYLTAEIDWSIVGLLFSGKKGIDPELGRIVLLINILILFQPLSIGEDSPPQLQLSAEQRERWSPEQLSKIAKICSTSDISSIFREIDFPNLDDDAQDLGDEDYLFNEDVRVASSRIKNSYFLAINAMQVLRRTP